MKLSRVVKFQIVYNSIYKYKIQFCKWKAATKKKLTIPKLIDLLCEKAQKCLDSRFFFFIYTILSTNKLHRFLAFSSFYSFQITAKSFSFWTCVFFFFYLFSHFEVIETMRNVKRVFLFQILFCWYLALRFDV